MSLFRSCAADRSNAAFRHSRRDFCDRLYVCPLKTLAWTGGYHRLPHGGNPDLANAAGGIGILPRTLLGVEEVRRR